MTKKCVETVWFNHITNSKNITKNLKICVGIPFVKRVLQVFVIGQLSCICITVIIIITIIISNSSSNIIIIINIIIISSNIIIIVIIIIIIVIILLIFIIIICIVLSELLL